MALDLRVRIAFTTHPRSGSPVWTDVSQFVDVGAHSVDITRGSGDLDSQINPSTLALTLDNHDGRFTPGYTGSPYYPNVILGKRIQVHTTTNGSTFKQRFDGFLDTLPMQWQPTGKYAEAEITAVDLLKKLGRQFFVWDVIAQTMGPPTISTHLYDYWPLSDVEGATVPFNRGLINGTNTQLGAGRILSGSLAGSGFTFGSATGPGTDGLTAADSLNSSLQLDHAQILTPEVTLMGFFRVVALDASFGIPDLFAWSESTGGGGSCWVDNTGVLKALLFNQLSGSFTLTGPSVNDGHTHHVACSVSMSGSTATMKLWLDGVTVDSNTLNMVVFAPKWLPTVFMQSYPLQINSTAEVVGAHLGTFDTATLTIADIANSGLNGFSPETSDRRFGRLATYADSISFFPGSTAGTRQMGPLSGLKGKSVLAAIQEVDDVEDGAFFINTGGDLIWMSRVALYNQASAWTLTAGQYGTDLTFLSDDSRLLNDVTVTDGNDVIQRVVNQASVDDLGTYSVSQDLNTLDTNEALGWASWQINVASTTAARVSQVTVNLLTQQSLLTTAWNLELGNRIDLAGLPTGAPASTVTLQVAGYTESYCLTNYTMTINTQPYLTGNIFIFDDATYGKLDGPGVFSY